MESDGGPVTSELDPSRDSVSRLLDREAGLPLRGAAAAVLLAASAEAVRGYIPKGAGSMGSSTLLVVGIVIGVGVVSIASFVLVRAVRAWIDVRRKHADPDQWLRAEGQGAISPLPAPAVVTLASVDAERSTRDEGSNAFVRAAELALSEINNAERAPREAIIAGYEIMAAVLERNAIEGDSAAQLVDVFTEARFSTHDMREADRVAAGRALGHIRDQSRGSA